MPREAHAFIVRVSSALLKEHHGRTVDDTGEYFRVPSGCDGGGDGADGRFDRVRIAGVTLQLPVRTVSAQETVRGVLVSF